ncbi:DNA gyrase inhibitor YacG [Agaribacter flavus]|uniref:DNA gyrase inhibitor YacG n=1 Tax=Agaribacter flavus TaxID=1902781 RepID=A0ABV7FKW2_9ALTE
MPTEVNCPTCKQNVVWAETSPFRPFCSKRCQLIDLGEWANEENRLATESDISDKENLSIDVEDIEALLAEQTDEFFKS